MPISARSNDGSDAKKTSPTNTLSTSVSFDHLTPCSEAPSTSAKDTTVNRQQKRKNSQSPPLSGSRRSKSPFGRQTPLTTIQRANPILPDHKTAGIDPDNYLLQLVEALWGAKLEVKKEASLEGFFPIISDEQVAAYNLQVVSMARENKLEQLREYYDANGKPSLDCYNRFGEGLLNLSCRRGFTDMTQFLMKDVGLCVRTRDDYGRTPLHDACWNPEPQLVISRWIMETDPSLFLISDRRGYTPFKYARKSDWHIWRKFLFDNRQCLQALVTPALLDKFGATCPS